MGIRVLVAAAAVAVGVGQAEAATYNVDFTITRAEHIYFPDDTEYTVTPLGEWLGLAVNTPLRGILDIEDSKWVNLVVSGVNVFSSNDPSPSGDSVSWLQAISSGFAELIWNGTTGSISYGVDNRPDYHEADAVFEIAPVPLPATAALLPLGFGALAMMRKRRRSISQS